MDHVSWYQIASLLGAVFGATLLWGILYSALRRIPPGAPLLLLVSSLGLWYTSGALDLIIGLARPGYPAVPFWANLSHFGLAFVPSALLSSIIVFAAEMEQPTALRVKRFLLPLAIIPGLLGFAAYQVLAHPPLFQTVFAVWLIICLATSALFCLRLSRSFQTAVHRIFYALIGWVLLGIIILVAVVHLAGGIGQPTVDRVLALWLYLSPLLPVFVLGYFVYRYYFFRIVVRPGLLYSALTGVVLIVYLLLIRGLARDSATLFPGINPDLVEVLLIVLLIFLFQPVKNRLQRFINLLFFRERYRYQQLIGELSRDLNVPDQIDRRLKSVLNHLCRSLKVHNLSLVLFESDRGEIDNLRVIAADGLPGFPEPEVAFGRRGDESHVRSVAVWLEKERRPLDTGELHRFRFVSPLTARGIQLCVPLFRDRFLAGFMALGPKKREVAYSTEERDLITALGNQIVLAVENARLVERRIEMERQMLEAERLSSLGLLSAGIAHEVRNPLGSIKAVASVLKEELSGDPAREKDLSIIIGEIDRLNDSLGRLLAFASPGREEKAGPLELKKVVDDTVALLHHEADKYDITVRVDMKQSLKVTADLHLIKEVLFNLVLNGIQAMGREIADGTGPEERLLKISAATADETEISTPISVRITVEDSGPGIDRESRPHIFDPFYTTRADGTGLGLAVARRNVERMGGRIIAADRPPPDRGTVFSVILPGVEHDR